MTELRAQRRGCNGGELVPDVRLAKCAQGHSRRFQLLADGVQLLFVGDFAENQVRVGIEAGREGEGGFYRGVCRLDGSLRGGKIGAGNEVDVADG